MPMVRRLTVCTELDFWGQYSNTLKCADFGLRTYKGIERGAWGIEHLTAGGLQLTVNQMF
jgi:hypothetical protein